MIIRDDKYNNGRNIINNLYLAIYLKYQRKKTKRAAAGI